MSKKTSDFNKKTYNFSLIKHPYLDVPTPLISQKRESKCICGSCEGESNKEDDINVGARRINSSGEGKNFWENPCAIVV